MHCGQCFWSYEAGLDTGQKPHLNGKHFQLAEEKTKENGEIFQDGDKGS